MKRTGHQIVKSVNKLFVGGLDLDKISEADLKSYFQSFGNVLNIHIPKDRDTSKAKKFGFITFDDYDPVDKITLNDHVVIKGMRLNVAKANPESPKLANFPNSGYKYNNKNYSYKQDKNPYQALKLQQHQQQQQQFPSNFGPVRSSMSDRNITSPYQRSNTSPYQMSNTSPYQRSNTSPYQRSNTSPYQRPDFRNR